MEKASGDPPPRPLASGSPLFVRLPCTGHQESHKAVYFPTCGQRRGCREQRKPCRSPVNIPGPHTEFLCCNRTAVYLPRVL